MSAHANQVSKVLAAAGHVKASPYKTFGRDVNGYQAMQGYDYVGREKIRGEVTVVTTSDRRGNEDVDKYADTLRAAGYRITVGRVIGGHPGCIRVHGK